MSLPIPVTFEPDTQADFRENLLLGSALAGVLSLFMLLGGRTLLEALALPVALLSGTLLALKLQRKLKGIERITFETDALWVEWPHKSLRFSWKDLTEAEHVVWRRGGERWEFRDRERKRIVLRLVGFSSQQINALNDQMLSALKEHEVKTYP